MTGRLNQDCVENLFSIIRGKGGFCDNPDVEQFKAAFKYFVADKLFVQSDMSNYKVDNDTILLNISNVAMAKYIKTGHTDVKKAPNNRCCNGNSSTIIIANKKCGSITSRILTQQNSC